jgi:excisionase family DNA binding protein
VTLQVLTIALTPEQLKSIVAEGYAMAIEAQQPLSDWTDQEGIAQHLGVSSPTIKKMAEQEGMPHVYVGSHRRFSRRSVDAWLVASAKLRNEVCE